MDDQTATSNSVTGLKKKKKKCGINIGERFKSIDQFSESFQMKLDGDQD